MGKSIVLTGGGSGGHVIPIIALLPEIKKHFDNIYYIGGHGIEKDLIKNQGLQYFEIDTVGLNRTHPFQNIKIPYKLLISTIKTVSFLKRIHPDIIFCKGGYITMPAIICGKILSIKTVCHESDISLGLANKIASKIGATILTGFYKTATLSSKFIYSGMPLRDDIMKGNKEIVINKYHLDTTKKTILIMGGSLGATYINDVIISALDTLTKTYNILHITGKNKANNLNLINYYQIDFCENIGDFYSTSDIIISRAGAGAMFEISLINKPSIFIPLPKSASRGDQIDNCTLAKKHGAIIIPQENLTRQSLVDAISKCNTPMTPITKIGNKKISEILTTFADCNPK